MRHFHDKLDEHKVVLSLVVERVVARWNGKVSCVEWTFVLKIFLNLILKISNF